MTKGWTWLALILVPIGLLLVAIPGIHVFMTTTAPTLHPKAEEVPFVAASNASPAPVSAVEKARQIVRATLAEKNLPGVSVAVGVGGEVVWAEGLGFANLENSVPITPDLRFRIGTASTVLTSAAAGLLLEDGRLKLDDEIQKYVPEFPQKQWPVTLRQVMGHTAGITSDGGDEGPLFRKYCESPRDALQYFAEDSLRFEPGTQYRYSNYDWILASAAIEAASGQPFLTFMQDRVFEPLGMLDTVPDPGPDPAEIEGEDFPLFILFREKIFDPQTSRDDKPEAKAPAAAPNRVRDPVTSYFPRYSADPKYGLHVMRPLDFSCYAGSSVFRSTASDLVRFGMAINSGKLLKPATVQLLQTSQRLPSGGETGYGLGWDLEPVTLSGEPARAVGHNGELLGGMAASLVTFPEQGMAVSVLSNISYADTFSLAVKVAEAFAEEGKSPTSK